MDSDYRYLLARNDEIIKEQGLESAILAIFKQLGAVGSRHITRVAIRAIGDFVLDGAHLLISSSGRQHREDRIDSDSLLRSYFDTELPSEFKLDPALENAFLESLAATPDQEYSQLQPTFVIRRPVAVRLLRPYEYRTNAIVFMQLYLDYLLQQVLGDALEEAGDGLINAETVEQVTE